MKNIVNKPEKKKPERPPIEQPIPKGKHFVEELVLGGEEPWWGATGAGVFPSEQQAAKWVGEALDVDPARIFRIRDYLGGCVWQSPSNKEATDE